MLRCDITSRLQYSRFGGIKSRRHGSLVEVSSLRTTYCCVRACKHEDHRRAHVARPLLIRPARPKKSLASCLHLIFTSSLQQGVSVLHLRPEALPRAQSESMCAMVLVCCETKEDGAVEGVAQPTEDWSAKLLMPAAIGFN